MRRTLSLICLMGLIYPTSAFANDKDGGDTLRKAMECFPAEDIISLFSKFDDLKPEKRDTVDAITATKFSVSDDGPWPKRFFIKDGTKETPFTIDADGQVSDFSKIKSAPKSSELCINDPTRVGLDREEDGIEFNIDFDIRFIEASGSHTLADLKDGAKDGKSFYKKLVPGPLKLMVPKMTHVSVSYDDKTTPANIHAAQGDAILPGLNVEPFGKTFVVSLEQLEDLGANKLVIKGGDYMLEPSPSIKKMKSLGFDEDDDTESDD